MDILFPVVVTTETLAPGELISPSQVEIRYIEQNSLRGAEFDDPSKLAGVRVKRRVSKDNPILSNNLCFVCKTTRYLFMFVLTPSNLKLRAKPYKMAIKAIGSESKIAVQTKN